MWFYQYLLAWLSALWALIFNRRSTSDSEQSEQLLQRELPDISGNAPAEPSAENLVSDSALGCLLVMRHGHRQDEQDGDWAQSAARPWDPPLSLQGRQQAREAAARALQYGVDLVISSPFQRCLETSAEIVAQLKLQPGQWLVRWEIGEVCTARNLFGAVKGDVALHTKDLDTWMWGGLSPESALEQFCSQEGITTSAALVPSFAESRSPRYPESLEAGIQRYSKFFRDASTNLKGRRVLVVTHGEAVRAAILMCAPSAVVYEVKHTACAVLLPESKSTGWQLGCGPEETGISWYEDE